MRVARNNTAATAIAIFLALTIAASLAMPAANAHTPPWEIPTWSYISVSPSIVGVNQDLLIVMWLNDYPMTAVGGYGDRWDGMTVEITKPDGSKETLGPFTSDPVGSAYASYTPTQVGTYKFIFKFAGDKITGQPIPPGGFYFGGEQWINDTYLPSESEPVYVTVQEQPIQPYDETPLPEGYWTRPIHGANRQWYQVAGNWLSGAHNPGRINNYCTGPETAHIMWTRQYWDGGVMGGDTGDIQYYTGLSYETFGLSPPIILNGRLYYNVQTPPRYGWYCVDLRTGEELFFHNTTGPIAGTSHSYPVSGANFDFSGALVGDTLNFGQVLDIEMPNQHGGFPYLWSTGQMGSVYGGTGESTTWRMFDAFTGNYICSIANVSLSGTAVYGKDGSILRYSISGTGANKRLLVWNTTQAIWYRTAYLQNQYWMWRPYLGHTFDGRYGFSLNASIPDVAGSILQVVENKYIIGGTAGKNNGTFVQQGHLWALNLKPDSTGKITPSLLWNITFTPPVNVPDVVVGGAFGYGRVAGPYVHSEEGVFVFTESMNRRRFVYSLDTGQKLWESAPEPQWNFYGMSYSVYKGKLLGYGYSGQLIAYDIKTGKVLWNWTSGTVGFEGYYENTPLSLGCIADNKIYLYSSEHSPSVPLRRDAHIWCVDLETGKLLWKIQHWGANPAIADGYLVDLDLFDNQIYCFGKGPSATTVTASPEISVHGTSVLVKGTVTDQCAGAQKLAKTLGFVNGVPAIADEDQEEWMEYLYQQRPCPANAKGVEVTLDALDPNGNFVHIGTVTSDMSGLFSHMFTPEVPGKYTIIATFAGSGAYGPSYAETAIGVDEAPPASPPVEYPQPVDPTWTIVGMGIAIIIAIAIAVVIMKRK
ncbi:MAG: PQQ-like beta-propeller repeat protein [Candidatus Bathyarchaeota archaeon]|nr:PQQ-like beta-propeller repeat protein [Candidatus Bathyarchaeota archaeon]